VSFNSQLLSGKVCGVDAKYGLNHQTQDVLQKHYSTGQQCHVFLTGPGGLTILHA